MATYSSSCTNYSCHLVVNQTVLDRFRSICHARVSHDTWCCLPSDSCSRTLRDCVATFHHRCLHAVSYYQADFEFQDPSNKNCMPILDNIQIQKIYTNNHGIRSQRQHLSYKVFSSLFSMWTFISWKDPTHWPGIMRLNIQVTYINTLGIIYVAYLLFLSNYVPFVK